MTLTQRSQAYSKTLASALAILLLLALVTWLAVVSWGYLFEPKSVAELSQAEFTAETGLRITLVGMTAGGGMIDLRYQVVDPDKAIIVHDKTRPPTLIDEETGTIISRPWHEHNSTQLHTAVTYYELLLNPGGIVRPGSRVTIQIGDSQLKHVPVQ